MAADSAESDEEKKKKADAPKAPERPSEDTLALKYVGGKRAEVPGVELRNYTYGELKKVFGSQEVVAGLLGGGAFKLMIDPVHLGVLPKALAVPAVERE